MKDGKNIVLLYRLLILKPMFYTCCCIFVVLKNKQEENYLPTFAFDNYIV